MGKSRKQVNNEPVTSIITKNLKEIKINGLYEAPLVNTNYFQVDSWLSDFTINYIFSWGSRCPFITQFYFFFFNQSFQIFSLIKGCGDPLPFALDIDNAIVKVKEDSQRLNQFSLKIPLAEGRDMGTYI